MTHVTQHDGPNPRQNRGQPEGHDQRERPWPSVADVDWWREEATEYVPPRRTPVVPERDPEIDFDLDDNPPENRPENPAGSRPARPTTGQPTADQPAPDQPAPRKPTTAQPAADQWTTVEKRPGTTVDAARGAPQSTAALIRERLAAAAEASRRQTTPTQATPTRTTPTRTTPTRTPPARTTGPEPAAANPPGPVAEARIASDPLTDGPGAEGTGAKERGAKERGAKERGEERAPWVGAVPGEEPNAAEEGERGADDPEPPGLAAGVGRATSPYARPPRVTRREVVPAPRRVTPMPPARITAPTPAVPVSAAPARSTVESPAGAGLTAMLPATIFDTQVDAVPALPRPRRAPAPTGRPRRARRHRRRGPWLGLPVLVVLLLASAFVAWASAEPFWLAAGHRATGTATVVARDDRCRVTFASGDGRFTTSTVDLVGVERAGCAVGTAIPAQMVSANAARAYPVDATGVRLRWGVGLAVLLLCGWGISWATGATRFQGLQRLVAIALSAGAPLVVAATMLVVSY